METELLEAILEEARRTNEQLEAILKSLELASDKLDALDSGLITIDGTLTSILIDLGAE